MKNKAILKTSIRLLPLLLLILSPFAQDRTFKIKVVADLANIRLEPQIGSTIIHQLVRDEVVEAVAKEGEWYKVELENDGKKVSYGYVHRSLVTEIEPAPDASRSKPDETRLETEKVTAREIKVEREEIEPPETVPPERVESEEIQAAPPPERREETAELETEKGYRLHFFLGGLVLSGGDLNKGTQGLGDFYEDMQNTTGEGQIKAVHLSYVIGGELSYPLTDTIILGFGAEFFRGRNESVVRFERTDSANILTTRPEIQAFPFKFTVSFFPSETLYIKGGIEYYLANVFYYYRISEGDFWQEWYGDATANDLGLLAGVGYTYSINERLGFFAEAVGRLAKVRGFEGRDEFTDSTGLTRTEEGKLYIYQGQTDGGASHPLLFIRDRKPTEPGVVNPEEAAIDFSGLSIRVGIRIHF